MKTLILFVGILSALQSPIVSAGPDGAELFDRHCVVCHRTTGQGSLGLPLQKRKFKDLSDSYLVKTIRFGRPGRVMPGFDAMSDAQVEAIVKYLRKWTNSKPRVFEEYHAVGSDANGKVLYGTFCAHCHGEKGQGEGKGTGESYSRERIFKVVPPAIGNTGFLDSASDAMLKAIITHGRKGTIMTSFAELGLSEQDIDDVIVYLRSLPSDGRRDDSGIIATGEDDVLPMASLVVDSPLTFEETVSGLKAAIGANNYRFFPDRYLEQGLYPEWEVNKKQVTIRYCNFNNLYDMLRIDPRLGVGLPCKFTVIETAEGKVKIVAINMALIARLFNNDQLRQYAIEAHQTQIDILDEVVF